MDYFLAVSIIAVLAWSAYSVMHSRQKAKKKALLFYSELIPHMEQYEFIKSRTQFPVLSGVFEGYKVKLVPEADKSVFQRLPRLYLRFYINVPNTVLLRLRLMDFDTQSNLLFLPSSFEKRQVNLNLHGQAYRLFLGEADYPQNFEDCLAKLVPPGNRCAEMLFHSNFIRVTILLAKGKQGSYIMTRAADFDELIFKEEFFRTYFQAVLKIQEELNRSA